MKFVEFLDVIREDDSSGPGKFVGARLTRESERKLMQWMRDNGLRKKMPRARLHVTVIGHPQEDFPWTPAVFDPPLEADTSSYRLERFGPEGKMLVLTFSVPELEKRHTEACEQHGIDWPHDTYQPHISLSEDPTGLNDDERLLVPTFPMYIEREYVQPFDVSEGVDRRRIERTEESVLDDDRD